MSNNESSKPVKRNSFFHKSNSLTRKNSIGLAKNNEHQQSYGVTKASPAFLFNSDDNAPALPNVKTTNSTVTSLTSQNDDDPIKSNTSETVLKEARQIKLKKSYSLSASLPSRNFKFKDDLKSLFDKFTHSSAHSNNKTKTTNLNSPNITSIIYSAADSPAETNSFEPTIEKNEITQTRPEIVKVYRNDNVPSNQSSKRVASIKDFSSTDSLIKSKLKQSQSFHSETDLAKKKLHESFITIKHANMPVEFKTFKTGAQLVASKPSSILAPPPTPPPLPPIPPVIAGSQDNLSTFTSSQSQSVSSTINKVSSFR